MQARLGVPALVLSTLVGTAVFSSLARQPDGVVVVVTGLVAILSAVLSALQTLFNFAEKAELHKDAGAAYASLKRRMDLFKLTVSLDKTPIDEAMSQLSALVNDLNKLEQHAPDVPDRLYDRSRREQSNDQEGV